MEQKYRIGIVSEEQSILKEGLQSLLSLSPDFETVGDLGQGSQMVRNCRRIKPHLVLMDLSFLLSNRMEVIRRIKTQFPEIKILALINHGNGEGCLEALRAGAEGCIPMDVTHGELIAAVRAILEGKSQKLDASLEPRQTPLTERERDVLVLIARGQRNREIATYLGISVNTVGAHRTNLMRKLNLHNVQSLTRFAIEKGLVTK
jgi:DNA-binding NarL/FixJ family response regulator